MLKYAYDEIKGLFLVTKKLIFISDEKEQRELACMELDVYVTWISVPRRALVLSDNNFCISIWLA